VVLAKCFNRPNDYLFPFCLVTRLASFCVPCNPISTNLPIIFWTFVGSRGGCSPRSAPGIFFISELKPKFSGGFHDPLRCSEYKTFRRYNTVSQETRFLETTRISSDRVIGFLLHIAKAHRSPSISCGYLYHALA
jgi:hypothetical protein